MKITSSIFTLLSVLFYAHLLIADNTVAINPLGESYENVLLDKSCRDPFPIWDTVKGWSLVCSTKTVFISSLLYNGNLGGLAGADEKCNTLTRAARLKGTFKAWLSDTKESPTTRFTVQPSYVYSLTDGSLIANNCADLTDGTIDHVINKSEKAELLPLPRPAWTNTTIYGAIAELDVNVQCHSWSFGDHNLRTYGIVGDPVSHFTGGWTSSTYITCLIWPVSFASNNWYFDIARLNLMKQSI